MPRLLTALIVTAATALGAQSAGAHHSFSAEFDANSPIELTGTVTKVAWANPHTFFYIDVTNPKGEIENWALEMGGPNALLRLGWKRDSLKPDDVITVEGHLARDGSNLANARTIIMASTGKRMLAGSSGGSESGGADAR